MPKRFVNVFLDQISAEQPPENPFCSRQKKPHVKSRNGCLTCRERRVKCDESYPSCHRCLKRGDTCRRRPTRHADDEQAHSIPSPISMPIGSEDESLNIDQLRLFYHFQTSTYRTLPIIAQLWERALPMAFEHRYLMHAALCFAARHLDFLCPGDERKNLNISRKHLSYALNLYRAALANPITDENRDSILCTTLFLYFEAWSDPEILPMVGSTVYNISQDQLYTFSKGMKHVCSLAIPSSIRESRVLCDIFRYRPIHSIQNVLIAIGRDCYGYQAFFEELFDQQGPFVSARFCQLPKPLKKQPANLLQPDMKASDEYVPMEAYDAYIDLARRLSIILSLLPSDEEEEHTVLETHPHLLQDVSRVVYSFPVLFHPTLMNMLSENDPRLLTLLYHFYRMANRLLPEKECWWAVRRTQFSERFLKEKLWGLPR